MIIGLTGTFASGKDTVADYFKNLGFSYHSCSDVIRDECATIRQETTRENLINMGNKLRSERGDGYLAKVLLKRIHDNKEKNSLIVSIRHPEEVKELKKDPNFYLIITDAPLEIRYARTQKRQDRPEDKDSFETFKCHEEQERFGTGSGQQLDQVAKMADYKINNDSTIDELNEKIKEIVKKIELE